MTAIEVLSSGTLTTVQDHPGRTGYWEAGVPPSGPMDDHSFRIGNRLVGNPPGAAGLELTLTGPRLRFTEDAVIAVTGAPMSVELDGVPVAQWEALFVPAGGVLKLGAIRGVGLRAYLLVRGGLGGEPVMGSRSVFAAAGLGGRALRKGDALVLAASPGDLSIAADAAMQPPEYANEWTLRVVPGPFGAPDYLTSEGLAGLFAAPWIVHHQSDRTGVRLTGPTPVWARSDGGDAGLHPSNILDTAYGVGTIMLAGDVAVVVGPDGPSLGGFVTFAQVIRADLWRLGQMRAGDRVMLQAVNAADVTDPRPDGFAPASDGDPGPEGPARGEDPGPERPAPARGEDPGPERPAPAHGEDPAARGGAPRRHAGDPVLDAPRESAGGRVVYRRAGERGLLVEFGEPVLDLGSRVRVHALHVALAASQLDGVLDLTPGVRSLHITHDPDRVSTNRLLAIVAELETHLRPPEELTIPTRTIHLPLAWRHSEAMLAVTRYQQLVREDAPWCPDNIEFIRRINGLRDEQAVQDIVLDATYLVLGLGDVYLGAPVAVPLDPRHRLVTTKYTPARTWTPANAVGIGGAFMCVYGIEGPGGYQLVGRTVPIWRQSDCPPWQLRHFDALRFELVGESELEELRAASVAGEWRPRVEESSFSLAAQARLQAEHAAEIAAFEERRRAAFHAERDAWAIAAERSA